MMKIHLCMIVQTKSLVNTWSMHIIFSKPSRVHWEKILASNINWSWKVHQSWVILALACVNLSKLERNLMVFELIQSTFIHFTCLVDLSLLLVNLCHLFLGLSVDLWLDETSFQKLFSYNEIAQIQIGNSTIQKQPWILRDFSVLLLSNSTFHDSFTILVFFLIKKPFASF